MKLETIIAELKAFATMAEMQITANGDDADLMPVCQDTVDAMRGAVELLGVMRAGYGEWHDAALELPPDQLAVLAVKELKNGDRGMTLAYCIREHTTTDPWTKEKNTAPYWVCGGNNNIIYWMPLPEIPKKEEGK